MPLRCVLLTSLLVLSPGCGSEAPSSANAKDTCFSVTPDASAAAIGAIAGKQNYCLRNMQYSQEDVLNVGTEHIVAVTVEGMNNATPAPYWSSTVSLVVDYVDTPVAPGEFHATDRCGFGTPTKKVSLGYEAYDAAADKYAEWSCKTCLDDTSTFDLSISSVVGHPPTTVGGVTSGPRNTIHGKLHAVCGPSTSPSMSDEPGVGQVTIDGPF